MEGESTLPKLPTPHTVKSTAAAGPLNAVGLGAPTGE